MKIASPLGVRIRLLEYAKRPIDWEITKGDKGAVVGEFNRVLEDNPGLGNIDTDTCRYIVWGFCFTPDDEPFKIIQSGDLTDGQIYALKKWVGFSKTDEDEWTTRLAFRFEARGVFNAGNAIHFVERIGPEIAIQDYLKSLSAAPIEIEALGMVQAAVEDLGGTVYTYDPNAPEYQVPDPPATNEPKGGYIPL